MNLISQLRNTVTMMLDDALAKGNLSQREYAQFFLRLKNLTVKDRMSLIDMAYATTVLEDVSKEFSMLMEQRLAEKKSAREQARAELKDINQHIAAYT